MTEESSIITHLFIEAFFNNKGLLTEEHLLHGKERKQLLESYGVFDGCEEGAKEIIAEIDSTQIENGMITFSPKSLSFFTHNIGVILTDKRKSCAYSPTMSVFGNDGKFDIIVLKISKHSVKNSLLVSLIHELTHAYQDYQLRIKGYSLSQAAQKSGYSQTVKHILNKNGGILLDMSRLMYMLHQVERNAYLAGLLGSVKTALQQNTFENIDAAMKYIKANSLVIKNYNVIKKTIDKFTAPNLNDAQKTEILNAANEVSGYGFKTYQQFARWATMHIDKVLKKIDKYLYMMIDKYLKVNEYLLPSSLQDLIFEEKS